MKIILQTLFALLFTALSIRGFAQNDVYVVAANGLNVRSSPGLDGKVLFTLPFETKV